MLPSFFKISTRYIGIFALERACRLIVIPEKDVQDFRKRRLTYAKPKWTLFFQEKPMQNLSGRDFFKKKTLWLGFGVAKPNLTFFAGKITFILGFSLGFSQEKSRSS